MSSEIEANSRWLWPVIAASVCWSVSDVLCDVVIEEDSDSEDENEIWIEKKFKEEASLTSRDSVAIDDLDEKRAFISRDYSMKSVKSVPSIHLQGAISTGMDGEQDAAVAGLVSTIFSYMMCLNRLKKFFNNTSATGKDIELLVWSPAEDVEWWFASFGGVMLFTHYILVLWAYDSAPSTVINPLVQMSSVWVLLGSAVPAFITGSTFITMEDLICYVIILVGGILPSLDSKVSEMFTRKFWGRPFVRYVVLSEVTLGLYDLLISYCLQTSAKKQKFLDLSATALEEEFFYLAWCWFSISFALSFAFIPRLNKKLTTLLTTIPKKIVFFSALSQVLTLLAFYFSAFAYAWFYQASIVHAAESSLEQAFNLIFAFILRKCFNVGRESAVKGMKKKILSCVIVSIGLFLIAFRDEKEEAIQNTELYEYNNVVDNIQNISINNASRSIIQNSVFMDNF